MLTLNNIQEPCLLVKTDDKIKLVKGRFLRLENLAELDALHANQSNKIVFVTPFCIAQENGMEARGDEPILIINVNEESTVLPAEIQKITKGASIQFQKKIEPLISDNDFAKEVKEIQDSEIALGNACQVVYSRQFEGQLDQMSPLAPLILFERLLKQQGPYMTFLFSDGDGRYFVGASPERQLEIQKGNVIKNPLAGTIPKGDKTDFKNRLEAFLADKKEINELSQILDEELKIMSQICPKGGKILGPFLRESGAVIHTEYRLAGYSSQSSIESLRASFHAPTLVGSPLQSAFRIIKKREKKSRRYYGGEIGVLEQNGDMHSAILIRTAEIFEDGRIVIQAGAGVVRDSIPQNEARETLAKATGLISALQGDQTASKQLLTPAIMQNVQPVLSKRNQTFSSFHFEDQMNVIGSHNTKVLKITIINNEDNFAHILAHMTRHMGYKTTVVDTFDFYASTDHADMVIIGPGPGDINDFASDRMQRLLEITKSLLENKKPIFGVCLGMQAIAKTLGIPVIKQAIPTQGLQKEIDFFGTAEKVGFYNSFSPLNQNIPSDLKTSIDEDGRIIAFKKGHLFGIQFHVESAMTQNGYRILKEALATIAPSQKVQNNSFQTFVEQSIAGTMSISDQKQFLLNLNHKGFTGEDVACLVKLFYEHMPKEVELFDAVDLCGTGGSGLDRINTSTISAFVLASYGVPVAKHGNKAASGRFGSFDLLEALGINIMAGKSRLESIYNEMNLAFLFARNFHPVFKHFAEARQEIGGKTIFNILGPLLNPARPPIQIIGTSNKKDMKLIAEAAKILGKKKVLVLNGSDGLDELTLTGETNVMELRDGEIESYCLRPEDFGLEKVDFSKIAGGDHQFNACIARSILENRCSSAHLNLVLANVALVLKFLGKVESYKQGVAVAKDTIAKGKTIELLDRYRQLSNMPDILKKITDNKRLEVEHLKKSLPLDEIFKTIQKSDRDFKSAVGQKNSLNLIAEIKKGSPSAGEIYAGERSVADIAGLYEKNGADAISVLTDEKYFRGALKNLQLARSTTATTPLLMKDFIIDEYQIYLARHYGADAILLIASILSEDQINWFASVASALNMDVLLETHDERELKIALHSKVDIIGINNRDLHTFEIDTNTFLKLYPQIPDDKIIVAESGYNHMNTPIIQGMANAVLVGTSIMKGNDMATEIQKIKTIKRKFKSCGIRTVEAAKHCESAGVDFVGLNFVSSSKRSIDLKTAQSICSVLKNTASVGVFQNQTVSEVNQIATDLGLDFVQLAGDETPDFCHKINFPIIKTIHMDQPNSVAPYLNTACMFIVDGPEPGSGTSYDYSQLKNIKINKPFLVAGGISAKNINEVLAELPTASGIDIASGIETDGAIDTSKINHIVSRVSNV